MPLTSASDAAGCPTIVVREPAMADKAGWLPLWDGYNRFYETTIPDVVTETTWNRLIDPESPMGGLVAAKPCGELAGFLNYAVHLSTWTVGAVCYLEDLFIDPACRSRGVGRMLIASLVDKARGRGWELVYWVTKEDNIKARAIYDRMCGGHGGYVRYHIDLESDRRG